MKALVYKNVNEISFEDIPELGFPKANWVKIKVRSSGICGSDIHKFFFQKPADNYLETNVLGHEITGEVTEIGENAVKKFKVGDRVVIEPLIPCQTCKNCLSEQSQLCLNLKSIGRNFSGGFADYLLVPSQNLWNLPDNVSFSEGTQIDLVAVAVHAINSCRPLVNNFCCAVIGDGPLGIIMAQVAKAQGASNVTIFAKHEYKRKIAEELGIEAVIAPGDDLFYQHFKNTFDIVFETVGGRQACTLNNAITITRPNGKIAVLGVFDFGYQPAIEVRTAFYKELIIVGINSYTKNRYKSDFGDALAMVNNGSINIKNIISHKFALQDYKTAFSLIKNGSNRIKILFEDS